MTATDAIAIAGRDSGDQSAIVSNAFGRAPNAGRAGDLAIAAPTLTMDNGRIAARTEGDGNAGNITVQVERLELTGGAQIFNGTGSREFRNGMPLFTGTGGPGQGGTLTVHARDSITIAGHDPQGFRSGLFSNAQFGTGRAGDLHVTAPTLELRDQGTLQSLTTDRGNAGNIVVNVGKVIVADGAQIDSGADVGSTGRGGSVTVTATEAISIVGRGSPDEMNSGFFSRTMGPGDAGRIVISTPRLTMMAVGTVSTATSGAGHAGDIAVESGQITLTGGSKIDSSTSGTGQGGTVTVMATDTVDIAGQGSGLSASTAGRGRGGDVVLQARYVELAAGASISAESTGTGNAGNVAVTTQDSILSTNGNIVTRATQADGGNIQVTAPFMVRLRDSTITAEVGGGAQTVGGNITIDPQFVLLQNSRIVANAFAGRGGNIRIQAQQVFLADPSSTVNASSELGINGQVNIQAPVTSISGSVALLPQSFARATELLRDRCAERVRGGGIASRLVLGGRDGVPLEPGRWLPSALQPRDPQNPARGGPYQDERHTDNVGIWHIDNTAQGAVKEQYAQLLWPGTLDAECTRWMGQQRPMIPSTR